MSLTPAADVDTTYVVCEGQADAVLLGRLLVPPFQYEHVRVLAANGLGMVVSLARTLLTTTPARVAIAVDGDAPSAIRGDLEAALAAVAEPARWAVFVFRPSVEHLLATEPATVAAVAGRPLSDLELAELSADPGSYLKHAAKTAGREYVAFIAELAARIDTAAARQDQPTLRALSAFVEAAPSDLLAAVT